MQQLPTTTLPGSERGATLVVALIMLILISLLGVSSLKNASVAEKMSAADHQKILTFQASESAAALAIRNSGLISQALIKNSPTSATAQHIGSTVAEAKVVLTPVGSSTLLGSSIAVGGNSFSAERIMITSTANINDDKRSTGETVHGIVQLLPGSI